MDATKRSDWFDSIAPAVIDRAWRAYCAELDADCNCEETRYEFEEEYCGTYTSIEQYMLDVYIPQHQPYRDVPWVECYPTATDYAEGIQGLVIWWATEDDGTVHVFETP